MNRRRMGPFDRFRREEASPDRLQSAFCSYCASPLPRELAVCGQCGAPRSLATLTRRPGERPVEHFAERDDLADSSLWRDGRLTSPGATWRPAHDPARAGRLPPFSPPARVRSFRLHAVIAFVLYFPFFLPGLIASAVWWHEARSIEHRTGITPPGKGCLTGLLLYGVVVSLFGLLVFGVL